MTWLDDPVSLPQRLVDLSNNNAPPEIGLTLARRRRIDQMEREIAQCAAMITDFDLYAEHNRTTPLKGNDVGPLMRRTVRELRAKTVARYEQLQHDLDYLRSHP